MIAAGVSGVGSLLGGILQNKWQKEAAQDQMDFQERMSSTAYQRAVNDMKMAGINPMLAYSQGGSSSPSGSQAQVSDVVGPAVASAQHGRRLTAEITNMEKQGSLLDAQRQASVEQAGLSFASAMKVRAETLGLGYDLKGAPLGLGDYGLEARKRALDLELGGYDIPGKRNIAEMEDSTFGRGMRYVDRVREGLFGGGGVGVLLPVGRAGRVARSAGRVGSDFALEAAKRRADQKVVDMLRRARQGRK